MRNPSNEESLRNELNELREKVETYRLQADTALRFSDQIWWSWNLRRRRIKMKSAGDCILGFSPMDMDRGEQFWWDKMHPNDRLEAEKTLENCLSGKVETWQCEMRLRDISGDWVWVEQSGFVTRRDSENNPEEMVGITRKSQEKHQLLDLFQGSESVVEAFTHESPFHFWLRDQEGIILIASARLQSLLGKTSDRICISELVDSEHYSQWQSIFHAALQGNKLESEISLKTTKGVLTFAHSLIPVTQHEVPFAVLEVFTPQD